MMNSKGFRMRRNREAKVELGITTDEQSRRANPERPLDEQRLPGQADERRQPSLLRHLWRRVRRSLVIPAGVDYHNASIQL